MDFIYVIKRILFTLLLIVIYNYLGYWVAEGFIYWNLATVEHTEFGVKTTTIGLHASVAIVATVFAIIHGKGEF